MSQDKTVGNPCGYRLTIAEIRNGNREGYRYS